MYVCVCLCVRTYVRTCVCMYICMCMHVHMHVRMPVSMHACIHTLQHISRPQAFSPLLLDRPIFSTRWIVPRGTSRLKGGSDGYTTQKHKVNKHIVIHIHILPHTTTVIVNSGPSVIYNCQNNHNSFWSDKFTVNYYAAITHTRQLSLCILESLPAMLPTHTLQDTYVCTICYHLRFV